MTDARFLEIDFETPPVSGQGIAYDANSGLFIPSSGVSAIGTGVSGTNTITMTFTPNFSPAVGSEIRWVASGTNTGAVTLNGIALVTEQGALQAGQIQSGDLYVAIHNGTSWVLQNPYIGTLTWTPANVITDAGHVVTSLTIVNATYQIQGSKVNWEMSLNGTMGIVVGPDNEIRFTTPTPPPAVNNVQLGGGEIRHASLSAPRLAATIFRTGGNFRVGAITNETLPSSGTVSLFLWGSYRWV